MFTAAAGVVVLGGTGALFCYCLPRAGKTHRFVGTEWEPYVGIVFCAGLALGFTMVLAGLLDVLG